MKMANQKFQDRLKLNKMVEDSKDEIIIPDINPQLTNLIQGL